MRKVKVGITKEDILKLPGWAQGYILSLERQREDAVKALIEYLNEQEPSPIFTEDFLCIGKREEDLRNKVRYIQSREITVEYNCVHLEVRCRDNGIGLQWWAHPRNFSKDVTMVPVSYQKIKLVNQ